MEMAGGVASMAKNGVFGGVTATLPLYAGGKIIHSNRLADVEVQVKELQGRLTDEEVRFNTEQHFRQIVTLRENLQTLDALERQVASLLRDVQVSVEAGVTNRNDLLQVQLRQNDLRSSRLTIENVLDLSRRLLGQYVGRGTEPVDIIYNMKDTLPPSPLSLQTEPSAAVRRTGEYGLLEKNVEAARLQSRLAVGRMLPTVAVGGGWTYENLFDRDHSFLMGFATVSIPIPDWWGGVHNLRRQRLQEQNARNDLADQSEQLLLRVHQTWNALVESYEQIALAVQSIRQSEENLRLQTDYYAAGTCTMSDLLEAQSLYRQARDKYVDVYKKYEVRKREYLRATGRGGAA